VKPEDRVDRVVSDLLRGKRLSLRAGDADEKEALLAAARLTAARRGPQRMSPQFRKRLARSLNQTTGQGWLTRRSALVAGFSLAAGATAGGLLGMTLAPTAERGGGGMPIEPSHGTWIDVAALSDLAEGQGQRVTAGGVGAYLFRNGSTVSAVSSVCTHLPCELRWNGSSGLLDCPCHPASFTPSGHSTSYSYPLPALNTVHVRVTPAGRVEVLGAV
jgi:nitrite reductase/ring-hydroxylating ferredoxin subunit